MPGPKSLSRPRGAVRRWALLACALLVGCLTPGVSPAAAAATPMVDLGDASTYAVISGASVGNTVGAAGTPYTTLRGDLGVKANAQPTGFPPGIVTGTKHVGDAAAAAAHADLVTAYTEVAARTGGTPLAGAMAGATITPGLHTIAGAVSNTTTVTLDAQGDPNAVFVFQVGGALAMAAGSHVVLANGARASRVFWQVNGAGAVGANADFAGTLMALDAVAVGNGTVFNGRAFARNGALTLDANEFYSSPPVVTIAGGANAMTTDTSPTISGTTDVQAPSTVTVEFAGQTLTATPSGGTWSVTSAIRANGSYPVVASVVDGAGNTSSSTQQLTIDTVLPVVTIAGGESVATADSTPTVAGTTDVASGTVVFVTVGAQDLTALVQPGGTWNITPASLADGAHALTATVADPAGNEGSDTQEISVDTTAPAATISGGGTALTNDATPSLAGIADVTPGATVSVTLADETLAATVGTGGTWSVVASHLADGPHRVVLTVADAVGNETTVAQWLTIDTVSPAVAILGGATATTTDLTPTISGTSDAAPGTTVTVEIAGQALTTLLQSNGTWNATPNPVGQGMWDVVASVPDPAGNVGTATQSLKIGPATPPPAPAPVIDLPPAADADALVTATTLKTGVRLECPAAAATRCTGKMLVFADATKKPKAKRLLIGKYVFRIMPGDRSRVVVKLNRAGKRRLSRVKTLRATLVAITHNAAGDRIKTTSHTKLRLRHRKAGVSGPAG